MSWLNPCPSSSQKPLQHHHHRANEYFLAVASEFNLPGCWIFWVALPLLTYGTPHLDWGPLEDKLGESPTLPKALRPQCVVKEHRKHETHFFATVYSFYLLPIENSQCSVIHLLFFANQGKESKCLSLPASCAWNQELCLHSRDPVSRPRSALLGSLNLEPVAAFLTSSCINITAQ